MFQNSYLKEALWSQHLKWQESVEILPWEAISLSHSLHGSPSPAEPSADGCLAKTRIQEIFVIWCRLICLYFHERNCLLYLCLSTFQAITLHCCKHLGSSANLRAGVSWGETFLKGGTFKLRREKGPKPTRWFQPFKKMHYSYRKQSITKLINFEVVLKYFSFFSMRHNSVNNMLDISMHAS